MANIRPATRTIGPHHFSTASPYSMTNQKHVSSKKLSHESSVVHDSSPAMWFRGSMKG